MMMWMWISSIVILFGAQLNSEIEHQTVSNSTVKGEKPLGARGAVMADTIGKANLGLPIRGELIHALRKHKATDAYSRLEDLGRTARDWRMTLM